MPPLSAVDAITPALARTRQMLFAPFRAGRSWKLAASAYLARSATLFLPFPLLYLGFLPAMLRRGSAGLALLTVAAIVALTVALAAILYLCTRLQFVVMELVLERAEFVAPAWRHYAQQSFAWTTFKFVAGLALLLVAAVPMALFGQRFLAAIMSAKPGEPLAPDALFGLMAGYGVFLVVISVLFLVSAVAHDVVLPTMALQGATVRQAFAVGWAAIRREPAAFTVFALLKSGLLFAGSFMAVLAVEVVLIVAGALVVLAGFLLHLAGVPTSVLIALGIATAVLLYAGVVGYLMLLAIGAVSLFIEAHSLYFLADRLAGIGELLARSESARWPGYGSPPPPFSTSPPPPLSSPG